MANEHAYTGSPERRITLGEMILILRQVADRAASTHRVAHSETARIEAEVLDAAHNLILSLVHCADRVMPILRNEKAQRDRAAMRR